MYLNAMCEYIVVDLAEVASAVPCADRAGATQQHLSAALARPALSSGVLQETFSLFVNVHWAQRGREAVGCGDRLLHGESVADLERT